MPNRNEYLGILHQNIKKRMKKYNQSYFYIYNAAKVNVS